MTRAIASTSKKNSEQNIEYIVAKVEYTILQWLLGEGVLSVRAESGEQRLWAKCNRGSKKNYERKGFSYVSFNPLSQMFALVGSRVGGCAPVLIRQFSQ